MRMVGQRRPFDPFDVGIFDIMRELARHVDVLLIAIVAEAFVALFAILRPQCIRIKSKLFNHIVRGHSASLPLTAFPGIVGP